MESYPQFDKEYDKIGDTYWPKNPLGYKFDAEPIGYTLRSVLQEMDIKTGVECDATLSLNVTLKAIGASYTLYGNDSSYCYSGASITGKVILTAPERPPLTLPIKESLAPLDKVSVCNDLTSAPYWRVWPKPILNAMTQLWGPRAALQAMAFAVRENKNSTIGEYMNVYAAGSDILEELGREAVPDLIEALEYRDKYVRREAASALKTITGQDYGENVNRWQEWWQGQD